MKYTYQTQTGMKGTTEATNRQEAIAKLQAQYGAKHIVLVDGKKPETAQGGDDHGWDRAFKTAASKT